MSNVCRILKDSKNIAVVGISDKLHRDSRKIALFLREVGYNVVGVNPFVENVENIIVYKSFNDIPFSIDIVDVFRKSESIPELIPEILLIKPKVLWLQLGIKNDEAVKPVRDAGIEVIQDRCIMIEYLNCK